MKADQEEIREKWLRESWLPTDASKAAKVAYLAGWNAALDAAARTCGQLHDVHPYDSGREPDCTKAILALKGERS